MYLIKYWGTTKTERHFSGKFKSKSKREKVFKEKLHASLKKQNVTEDIIETFGYNVESLKRK